MGACLHCRERKGKRECPALGGRICARCCGQHRRVEIRCPDDCPHLASHEEYQQGRALDRVPRPWMERLLRYEQGGGAPLAILHRTQVAMVAYAAEVRPLEPEAAREGLEFARRRMSLIETAETYVPPFGAYLLKRLDEAIEEQAPVDRSGVREVLDETLRFLEREVPAEGWGAYVEFLRAVYGPALAAQDAARSAGGSGLILPG
jgi:hypothetical protein